MLVGVCVRICVCLCAGPINIVPHTIYTHTVCVWGYVLVRVCEFVVYLIIRYVAPDLYSLYTRVYPGYLYTL